MIKDEHWILIGKYLANECSPEERMVVRKLICSDEGEELIEKLSMIYETSVLNEINMSSSFQKLTNRLKDDNLLSI